MQRTIIVLTITLLIWSIRPVIANSEIKKEPLKVAFILVGRGNDMGWNYAHDQGRLFLEKAMAGKVSTTFVENVPESGEVERVIEKLIAQGNKLIFTTSYGYLEPAIRAAARHPEIIIMQCQRSVPASVKNAGTYDVRQYEPYYAAGIVAGKMTKTNKLGYIGGHPVPLLIACLNAYALGAQSVNPKVIVKAVWLNTWEDATLEVEATKGLIDSGVDIVSSILDSSLTTIKTCNASHVFSIGQSVDLSKFAPQSWITGEYFNWGPLYVKISQSVIDHTWRANNTIYDTKHGYVGLCPCGKMVPTSVRKEAEITMKNISDGKLKIFKGPLKDRDGNLKIENGRVLSDTEIANMNWVVSGIEGSMPKQK